jgi:predicted nuclease of restriction endonuclease-like RecB superfamily
MLTADLLRGTVRKGRLHLRFIDPVEDRWQEGARALCALMEQAEGMRRSEWDQAVDALVGDDADTPVLRGMAKLVEDRCEWAAQGPCDPVALRRRLFEEAAAGTGTLVSMAPEAQAAASASLRADVLARVGASLGLSEEETLEAMYADLRTEHRLVKLRPLEAGALLDRYNVALVQGALLQAESLEVKLQVERGTQLRAVYRQLKFHQLMHRTHQVSPSLWAMHIDGPLSLFSQGQRYGLQLALFFPALLHLPAWSLQARVRWGRVQKTWVDLQLTSEEGLRTDRPVRGVWITPEDAQLETRLQAVEGWEVSRQTRLVHLGGQDTVLPDLCLTHRATGRQVQIEIIGYWRRAALAQRRALMETHAPAGLIVCVSRRLAVEGDEASWPDHWVAFKDVIPMKKVMALAEAMLQAGA